MEYQNNKELSEKTWKLYTLKNGLDQNTLYYLDLAIK